MAGDGSMNESNQCLTCVAVMTESAQSKDKSNIHAIQFRLQATRTAEPSALVPI